MMSHDSKTETAVGQENENAFTNTTFFHPHTKTQAISELLSHMFVFPNCLHISHLDDVTYRPQQHRNRHVSQRLSM
jgi:hypothetical protein